MVNNININNQPHKVFKNNFKSVKVKFLNHDKTKKKIKINSC